MFKKFDKVRLLPKYENQTKYVVAEVNGNGIAHLFPVEGGFRVSADVKNLRLSK